MHPTATPSGWLLGTVPRFDATTDLADRVIAQLLARGAVDDVVEVRRSVLEVDALDEAAIAALFDILAKRAAELSS